MPLGLKASRQVPQVSWSEGKAYLEQNLQDLVTYWMRGLHSNRAETDTPPAPRPHAGSALCWGRGGRAVGAPFWGAEMAPAVSTGLADVGWLPAPLRPGLPSRAPGRMPGVAGVEGRAVSAVMLRLPAGFCLF